MADSDSEYARARAAKKGQRQLARAPIRSAQSSASRLRRARIDPARYRPGVGVILLNIKNQVFVGRRIDIKENAWQMPQGGINSGESPRHAALRELAEEIGTNNVEVLAETQSWIHYDLPKNMVGRAWNGRWRGQRQKWFIMRYLGVDSAVNIASSDPEFDDWRWVPPCELPQLAVSFKRQVYVRLLIEFENLLAP